MPIILSTQPQDIDIAEAYALDVCQSDPRKNPETFYTGALGELAFARWDGPETYDRCVAHLRRGAAPAAEDWRYDFVSRRSYLIDVKSVGYDNVRRGFGDMLISKPDPDVTYVLLYSLGPSNRVFEFSGWVLGSQIHDMALKPLARDNHKFVRVRKRDLNPIDKW